ncbi:MAG: hypothetical protein AB7V27_15365 [Candidatus Binatia bacterium]
MAMLLGSALALLGALAALAAAAQGQTCPAPGTGTAACQSNCASLSVGTAMAPIGGTGAVSITFEPGPDNGQAQRGNDDVAAIAFTVGIPGTGEGAPLQLACTGGNLAEGAVAVGAGIANDFTVVVENAQCNNRNRCLCPDAGQGQTRDNFVNIVIYGPKSLPEQGPVTIPELPSGELVRLNLRPAATATPGAVTVHVFSALDATKPQFAANLSMGDQSACDVTANGNQSAVLLEDGTFTIEPGTGPSCTGDCDGGGAVNVSKLITAVNIALGNLPVTACGAADPDGSGTVTVNELIAAVNNALNGCPTS